MAFFLTSIKELTKRLIPSRFEEIILPLYETTFLKKYTPSIDLSYEVAEISANLIPDKAVNLLEENDNDKYIITTGTPKNMVLTMLKERGIDDMFNEIYANQFEVIEGRIIGFDHSDFFMGRFGKRAKALEIKNKGYDKLNARGDTFADLGMFDVAKETGGKICTSSTAPRYTKNIVEKYKKGGVICTNMIDSLAIH